MPGGGAVGVHDAARLCGREQLHSHATLQLPHAVACGCPTVHQPLLLPSQEGCWTPAAGPVDARRRSGMSYHRGSPHRMVTT